MGGEAKALLKVWSTILASLCYCYFIASKFPKGKLRLFSILPIIILFTLLPLTLSSTLPTGITAFFVTWLASSKLLLFAFDLGPLSPQPSTTIQCDLNSVRVAKGQDVSSLTASSPSSKTTTPLNDSNNSDKIWRGQDIRNHAQAQSLLKFIFIAAFPIKIKDPLSPITRPKKVLHLNFWSETLTFSVLVAICDVYKGKLDQWLVFVIYCCMLYLFIDVMLGICNKLVGPMMGLELLQPSDEPYVATSLQDFWGRRWNLMVTDALRHTVYNPVRVFLSKWFGPGWGPRAVGVMASFLVSGLVHELIFYYMARVSPTWEVTFFFVLHGVCVVLEWALKRALGKKFRAHWAVTGPLTVGFVMGTGYWLFFPPLLRNQVDVRAIEEAKVLYEMIKGVFV